MSEFTYFPDGQLDRMAGLVWQLAQELHVTRQRLLALEQVLVDRGGLPAGAVDGYRPSGPAAAGLRADGDALLERLLRSVSDSDDHRSPLREQFQEQLDRARV
ncbi:hypothetical protein [Micromonospora sp. NPDC047074]|uniref:hypothetical protein n=1 Tax=Micromonospora sp. NPDC047074 TaxID=3154339 RepID=UPI0033FFAD3A